ncbi:unnamed protein product [Onchocerca flexuosa]|uniref:Uncharacterized protein n=1 Tax=Onchocerca flexuosa TaxID=387005 RepID=A0A183HUF5_9BILA|nr:unnamed protein product [Onchocerca flexuosa]
MVASYVFPHDATSPATEATLILSSSPSSVATIEKTKQQRQQSFVFMPKSYNRFVHAELSRILKCKMIIFASFVWPGSINLT